VIELYPIDKNTNRTILLCKIYTLELIFGITLNCSEICRLLTEYSVESSI
jgi:hypothetical protein